MIGKKLPVSDRAMKIHRESLVLDCHSHFLINGTLFRRKFHTSHSRPLFYNPFMSTLDLDALVRGGVKAQGFTSYVPGRPLPRVSDRWTDVIIDRYYQIIDECGGKVVHCNSAAEIESVVEQGRFASFLTIEGGHVLEGKLENVHRFHQRGVRMLTLTHFVSNGIADGTTGPVKLHGGLSDFGRQVVKEMNKVGMMVDVAHCTDKALRDVLKLSSAPPIYSHGALRRFRGIERNLSDDGVKAIADAGGLIGIIFFPRYLGRAGSTVSAIARQAGVVADLVGPDKVCLGSDMDGFTWTPFGFRDASDWPQVTQALLNEGFSEDETRSVLGGNFLRYFRKVAS